MSLNKNMAYFEVKYLVKKSICHKPFFHILITPTWVTISKKIIGFYFPLWLGVHFKIYQKSAFSGNLDQCQLHDLVALEQNEY